MTVRVPHAMWSSGLSTSMAEVAAMFKSVLCKRVRSSYESSPSVSPPDLLSRKHYREERGVLCRGMRILLRKMEGLLRGSEGTSMHDEGYGLDDKRHGKDDESRGIDDEGHSVESDGLGLEEEEEEAILGGQQQTTPVVGKTVSAPLGLGYEALRRRELALEEGDVYSTFEVEQGFGSAPESERPERTFGSLPISPSHFDVPSPISSPMVPLSVPSPIATPATAETEGFRTKLGAQVEMQGGLIRDHAIRLEELSPAMFESTYRSWELVLRQERVVNDIWSDMEASISPRGIGRSDGCPESSSVACHQ
ncbi:hypothetical protein Tco_1090713 [Tanacetum coccineum]|uniref:Uncharacterized protein n=1 Tax=Tanacetum coccineum TaxID=301880 RepID=A0ABQ5I520_9ASTR